MYLAEMLNKDYAVEKWSETKQTILLEAPTGCGKTYFAIRKLSNMCIQRSGYMAIIMNRKVLKCQMEKECQEFMFENHLTESPISFFTYQELEGNGDRIEKKLDYLANAEFVVLDEVHYFVSDGLFNPAVEKSFSLLMSLIGKVCLVLMTATPTGIQPLLDRYISTINEERLEEWKRKCDDIREQAKEGEYDFYFLNLESFENKCKKLAHFKSKHDDIYQQAEDWLKEMERLDFFDECNDDLPNLDWECECPQKPKVYGYELVSGGVPDYSCIQLHTYRTQDELINIIVDSAQREKWLIFVATKRAGKKLKRKLECKFKNDRLEDRRGRRTVAFVSADYKNTENIEMQKIIKQIVREESYSASVLITTAVLDNGITISDARVKNIVINAFSESEFKQMLGRRRVHKNEEICLYIPKNSASYYKKVQRQKYNKFEKILPVIMGGSEDLRHLVLEQRPPWEVLEEYVYVDQNGWKLGQLSYYLHSQEYLNLKKIIPLMEADPDAYVKSVCQWLGKTYDSVVEHTHGMIKNELYAEIEKKICSFPIIMPRKTYKELIDSINEIAIVKINSMVDMLNEFLAENDTTRKYSFESISIAKHTYYCRKINGRFPFCMVDDIADVAKLEMILSENKKITEVFQRLFGLDMPEVFNEEEQVSFLTICVGKTQGFEAISFRRGNTGLSLYKRKGDK